MKAIIFDFDGTLADTLPICFHAFQTVFKKYDNRELSTDEIKAMFGPSETGIIRENLIDSNYDQAIELYYEKYSEKHTDLVEANKEIDQLLAKLKQDGYKLGIVTGKARRSLLISLDCLNMADLFESIITGDDVDQAKPHPEGVYKALEELGVKNSDALFLGDSDADIQAGKQADVYTIGVQWLLNYQTPEFSVQPDHMLNSVEEFVEYLESFDVN